MKEPSAYLNKFTRITFLMLLLFISSNILPVNVSAQSQGPKSPSLVTEQYFACLSCPGSDWLPLNNIKVSDSTYDRAALEAYPQCTFGGSCHYARNLIASGFGFTIPFNAIITGIKVDVQRKAGAPLSVVDTIVQLMKRDTAVGNNEAMNLTWPFANTSISYGDSTDLWGTTWLPADVNDSGFGLTFKPTNKSNDTTSAYVDHVQITVYYTGINGISLAPVVFDHVNVMTEPSSKDILVSYTISKPLISFSMQVLNATGQCVFRKEYAGGLSPGTYHETIGSSGWASDLYIVRIASPEESFSRKVLITN